MRGNLPDGWGLWWAALRRQSRGVSESVDTEKFRMSRVLDGFRILRILGFFCIDGEWNLASCWSELKWLWRCSYAWDCQASWFRCRESWTCRSRPSTTFPADVAHSSSWNFARGLSCSCARVDFFVSSPAHGPSKENVGYNFKITAILNQDTSIYQHSILWKLGRHIIEPEWS